MNGVPAGYHPAGCRISGVITPGSKSLLKVQHTSRCASQVPDSMSPPMAQNVTSDTQETQFLHNIRLLTLVDAPVTAC
jgi:hypothetical protein